MQPIFGVLKRQAAIRFSWTFCRWYCEKAPKPPSFPQPEPEDTTSFSGLLIRKKAFNSDLIAFLNRKDAFSIEGTVGRLSAEEHRKDILDQRYQPERHKILGPNLAAAHFIVTRGGAVKFCNQTEWIRLNKKGQYNLPRKFEPNLYVEEIDGSNMRIMYEGFSNLVNLYHLKRLILRNCEFVDDWCLDCFHIFTQSVLEHLDLSGCHLVTDNGLCSLHKLRNLKTLVIEDLPNVKFRDLISIMIEDNIPGCQVLNSKYMEADLVPGT